MKHENMKQTLLAIHKASRELEENFLKRMGGKPVSPTEIQGWLDLKADKKRVDIIDEIKVDKPEIENYLDLMSKQNRQFIALIAILLEYLQLTIPKGSIAENASISKRSVILKRMFNLFQSVNICQDFHESMIKSLNFSKKTENIPLKQTS
jgi:hypothetical protein